MEPYYDRDGITIYCGETLLTLCALDERFDLVMADPPYGETSLQWDRWQPDFPGAVRALLNSGGSMWCFGSTRLFHERAADFAGWKLAQDVVWEKQNGSGLHADRFRRVHEIVAHFYPKGGQWSDVYTSPQFSMDATARTVRRKALPPQHQGARGPSHYVSQDGGPRLMRSVLQFRNCHGNALHPTQKPEGLVRTLMRYALKPGGTVLVPYMGSGTDVVIARELGAQVVAVEGQERYCEAAVRRLQQSVLPLEIPA